MRVQSPAPRAEWRAVVSADPFSLPEHAPEWVDALCASGRYEDATRLYTVDDGRQFVVPLVRRRGLAGAGGWLASYPPAWGMGGIVGDRLDADVVGAVVADLSGLREGRIWIRPDPMTAGLWAAVQEPGMVVIPRRAHVLDLTPGPEALLAGMSKSTRRGIRLAQRAVRVEVDRTGELLPIHYDLYLTSVNRWAQKQHEPRALAQFRARRRDSLAKLQAMARCLDKSFVVSVAFVGDRPAASLVTLLGRSAHDSRAAMDRELAAPARANELLQWEAINMAADHGCRRYHFGESGQSASLAHFKEKFGAVPVTYEEVRLERYPFTRTDTALRSAAKRALRFRDA